MTRPSRRKDQAVTPALLAVRRPRAGPPTCGVIGSSRAARSSMRSPAASSCGRPSVAAADGVRSTTRRDPSRIITGGPDAIGSRGAISSASARSRSSRRRSTARSRRGRPARRVGRLAASIAARSVQTPRTRASMPSGPTRRPMCDAIRPCSVNRCWMVRRRSKNAASPDPWTRRVLMRRTRCRRRQGGERPTGDLVRSARSTAMSRPRRAEEPLVAHPDRSNHRLRHRARP